MRILFKIILIQIGVCSLTQAVLSQAINLYGVSYDTNYLKNETRLIFSTTDELRIIRMINTTIDTVIFSYSRSYVGRLKADYDNYFVLYGDQEGYNWMRIYDKQTGKNIVSGDVIEFDTTNNLICYADWNKPNMLSLFDFINSKYEKYITPSVPCLHWWYCIKIIGITEKELTIQYTGKNNIKLKKVYIR